MNLIARAEGALSRTCNMSFEELMAPIDDAAPAGVALVHGPVGSAIRRARQEDDASLPRGAWEQDLKRADWDAVISLSIDGLARKGKDLQVAAWLLEALVHRHGFAALAGGVHLLVRLCEQYWDELHPRIQDGDYAYRSNIFLWIDEKVAPRLRQVPLATGSAELSAALAATPDEVHVERERELADAREMLAALSAMLERRLGGDAPPLARFAAVLDQAHGLAAAELARRGVAPHPRTGDDALPSAPPVADAGVANAPAAPVPAATPGAVIIRDRAQAYALLAQAISFLQQTEPHSPAPHAGREAN